MKNETTKSEARTLPSALRNREVNHLIAKNTPAFFLDYDGTLTEIVNEPAKAFLSKETRVAIERLSSLCTVSILSGRDVDDVRRLVNVDGLIYAGSHGFDIITADGKRFDNPEWNVFLPILDEAENELRSIVGEIPGAMVERKRFAISVHYRNVEPHQVNEVQERFMKVASSFPKLRKSTGKKVFELLPNVEWNKGLALTFLLDNVVRKGEEEDRLPVFIGDDITDEDGFSAVRSHGIGVLVTDGEGNPRTLARYTLQNPTEVRIFLESSGMALRKELEEEADVYSLWYRKYDPALEKMREALCTTGNGFFATRGASPESTADSVHYPGTYVAGCYNRLESNVSGQELEHESLVNVPNWLPLTFKIEHGKWFDLSLVDILNYDQELNLQDGILTRKVRFKDADGRITRLVQRRFVHMEFPHLAGLETSLVAENWHGNLIVRSALDGTVKNLGVERYKELNSDHLIQDEQFALEEKNLIYLAVKTTQSKVRISEAARTTITYKGQKVTPARTIIEPKYIGQEFSLELEEKKTVLIEKIVSIYTSKDTAISECGIASRETALQARSFSDLIWRHMRSWRQLQHFFGITVHGDSHVALEVNLNVYHLLQTASPNSIELDVGIPARGLTGEGYRGHILWDELFVFSFLNIHIPALTRSLLMYRYRRLAEAKRAAAREVFRGAMYPWQSGSDGREESQSVHLNPRSNRWIPDNSHLQRHINVAIAYNIWSYFQISGDFEFLVFYGAHILIEISRFFASIAKFNSSRDRFEIHGVMGPDEYHDAYPEATEPGLDNNAYTNVMVVWVLRKTLEALQLISRRRLEALLEQVGLSEEELSHWEEITRKMFVPFQNNGGIISQFEGYEKLKEFDWDGYRKKYGDIQRLDRILEAEGDSPNNYKISKQADLLMLFYLLSYEELKEIFSGLGYVFEKSSIRKNIEYYVQRTSNGSTLSRTVHSWLLARINREKSWQLCKQALESDVSDIQGGTTAEGIHLGAMGSSLSILQRCYLGLTTAKNVLWLDPTLPKELKKLEFSMWYRGHLLKFTANPDTLTVRSSSGSAAPIKIRIAGKTLSLGAGQTRKIPLGVNNAESRRRRSKIRIAH